MGRGFLSSQNIPTMEQFGQTVRLAPGVSLEKAYGNFIGGPFGDGRPIGGGGSGITTLPDGTPYNPGRPIPTPKQGGLLETVINPIRPGHSNLGTQMGSGSLTLAGMAQQPVQQPIQQPVQQPIQQPVQQPIQQPMQNPFGGGLGSLNQQPFGGGLSSLNQQPQQMNGGLKGLLDGYIGNYINNYFMNALK